MKKNTMMETNEMQTKTERTIKIATRTLKLDVGATLIGQQIFASLGISFSLQSTS